MTKIVAICSACALALSAGEIVAWADPAAPVAPVDPVDVRGETIVVVGGAAAQDRDRALGDTPFVSVLRPDDHPATASVAEAVATAAGAQMRSLGGLGAFESVSIRGQAPGQTTVFVDGVPLSRLAAVTTDLGRFALDEFGQVDLYRGAVPIELGGAGVGGALDLVTRLGPGPHGERISVTAGAGSYGAAYARAHYGDAHARGRWLSSVTAGYQRARGDFSYFSNNGTPLNPADDTTEVRRNNQFWQADGAARLGMADGAAAGGVRVAYKDQGLPGSVAEPATAAGMTTLDVVADARGDADAAGATARTRGYGVVETQTLRDPMGELGLGAAERRGTTLSGGAQTTWRWPFGLAAGLEARGDHYRDADLSGAQPASIGARYGGAALASFDVRLARSRVVITPAVRLDVERTSPGPATVGPMAEQPVPARWDIVPSPRLGARAAASSDLAIKGSAGWYERRPTLIELFGDRGFILGSPTLLPETGVSADAGIVWAPAAAVGGGAIDRVLVEADGFATESRNTIAFVTYAGYVARATNLGRARTYGGELTASARAWKTVSVTASYTRLASAQVSDEVSFDGKPIPRDPGHLVYARATLARAPWGHAAAAWIDVAAQSSSTIDPAAMGVIPGRALLGCGARVAGWGGASVALDVANATDVRVQHAQGLAVPLEDVAGFPLPGRSFLLSVTWAH